MIDQLTYFWLLLKASLFSTGGMGNLPSIHGDMIARGWGSETDFGESLAIGQISPGPSGLWVISFAYLSDGLRGSILATFAIILPPLLVIGVERVYRRIHGHPAVDGAVRGLGLAVVGVFVVVLYGLLQGVGLDVRTVAIAAVAVVLMLTGRLPVIGILALAGVVGMVAG